MDDPAAGGFLWALPVVAETCDGRINDDRLRSALRKYNRLSEP